jgi:hypothetical protein
MRGKPPLRKRTLSLRPARAARASSPQGIPGSSKAVQSVRRVKRLHLEDSFDRKRGQPARAIGGKTFCGGQFIPFVASWLRLLWPAATFADLTPNLSKIVEHRRSYSQAYTASLGSPFQPMKEHYAYSRVGWRRGDGAIRRRGNCGLPVHLFRFALSSLPRSAQTSTIFCV